MLVTESLSFSVVVTELQYMVSWRHREVNHFMLTAAECL